LVVGCAGPGPKLLPASPQRTEPLSGGGTLNWYDTNADGQPDYAEQIGQDGRVCELRYGHAEAPESQEVVDLRSISPAEKRDLVLILDSVPYCLVKEAWQKGMLRYFHEPTRVVAPFPVMTDPSLVDFFHLVPGVAIESDYYDGRTETDAYKLYLNGEVAIWHAKVDYSLRHVAHAWAYLDQVSWFDHELRRIQDEFERSDKKSFVAYCVGTSALGARQGREGHEIGLSRVDRFCREMMYRTRGRLRITLLSDHGHNLVTSHRIPLSDLLRRSGYHITTGRLTKPQDIVVPEFAMATCAAIYTCDPESVGRDVVKIEGIELSAFMDESGDVVVLDRNGRARISRSNGGYRYKAVSDDPLGLVPIWKRLGESGQVDPDGFVADAVLAEATEDHVYPDAADRLWRAFHEQFQHKPDVLISVADGYHCGSELQSNVITLRAAHGNLRPLSTFGFAASSAGRLPATVRMRDLAPALKGLGVDVLSRPGTAGQPEEIRVANFESARPPR